MTIANLKVSTRLVIVLVIFMSFLAVVIGVSFFTLLNAGSQLDKIVNENNERERASFTMIQSQNSIVISMYTILALENLQEMEKERQRVISLEKTRKDSRAKIQTMILDDAKALEIGKEADLAIAEMDSVNQKTLEFLFSNRNQEAVDLYNKEGKPKTAKAVEVVTEFMRYQQQLTEEAYNSAVEAYNMTRLILISITVIAFIVSLSLFFIISRSITGPLNLGVERVSDLAQGEGDLTKRIDLKTKDELGELGGWIDQFIIKIHDNVVKIDSSAQKVSANSSKVEEAAQNVSSGTEEMSNQATTIASAATEMSQNLQNVSASIEEMSISVQEVAKKAADARSIAVEASQAAGESNAVMGELSTAAEEIGVVIDTIAEIASQTNLLALNAAIEAAGAGEVGRGFAVVAQEVKELARQVATSSDEIRVRILGIQESSTKTSEAIANIVEVINRINEISSSIAAAVEQQSITTKEIASNVAQTTQAASDVTQNINGIGDASKEGAINASKAQSLAKGLEKLSKDLDEVVGQFKVHKS